MRFRIEHYFQNVPDAFLLPMPEFMLRLTYIHDEESEVTAAQRMARSWEKNLRRLGKHGRRKPQ